MQENRVLLVEDDPAIVENLTAFLKGEGFRITAVDGQQKAMEKLEEEVFDLALPGCVAGTGEWLCRLCGDQGGAGSSGHLPYRLRG